MLFLLGPIQVACDLHVIVCLSLVGYDTDTVVVPMIGTNQRTCFRDSFIKKQNRLRSAFVLRCKTELVSQALRFRLQLVDLDTFKCNTGEKHPMMFCSFSTTAVSKVLDPKALKLNAAFKKPVTNADDLYLPKNSRSYLLLLPCI